jgi:hypothetical protein
MAGIYFAIVIKTFLVQYKLLALHRNLYDVVTKVGGVGDESG